MVKIDFIILHLDLEHNKLSIFLATSAGASGVSGTYLCRVSAVPAINLGLGGPSFPAPGILGPTPTSIPNIPALSPIAPIATIPDPAVVID